MGRRDSLKIYIAGHTGMVGSALVRFIEGQDKHEWVGAGRNELVLTDRGAVFDYLARIKPNAMVIAAAKVGGIAANNSQPVEFLTDNLQIQTNLMDAAHAAGVERVVFLGSSCIYPKFAPQPIKEEHLLTGELEPTNEPYALAKIAGLKLIQAYRKQHAHQWISLMPTNLYGPADNYDPDSSHVIPGMISKFCKAKGNGARQVTLWGTGSPLREFLHVDDLASATMFALDNYNGEVALNVGSGEEVSISTLAQKIRQAVGFDGDIRWEDSMPDGTPRKALDSSRILNLGWRPAISLDTGLAKTVQELPFKC